MKCKDMKREIKRLSRLNQVYREKISALEGRFDEHRIRWNRLEIIVRPEIMPMYAYEWIGVNLRILGSPNEIPDRSTYRRISLTALDLIRENKREFIKGIGELMATELLELKE